MKKLITGRWSLAAFILLLLLSCNGEQANQQTTTTQGEANTEMATDDQQLVEERLRRFDSLDFQFYNNQDWDSFAISHADNIKVFYPDGTITEGLYPEHIDMLTPLFAFAPDTKIKEHPISFGTGDWTTVVGEMEGTFTKPMKMPDGKTIPPTGKKFKLRMCTVAKWDGGKIVEEHLFWDNLAMMKQIGVVQ
ncbi:ester cyclase [Pontibacter fetidus]|nr:ester cyclase [Pontibacter fetidus]